MLLIVRLLTFLSFFFLLLKHYSETMRLDTGLIIEVWNKGMLWDSLLGLNWLPLRKIHHSNQVGIISLKDNCMTMLSCMIFR